MKNGPGTYINVVILIVVRMYLLMFGYIIRCQNEQKVIPMLCLLFFNAVMIKLLS